MPPPLTAVWWPSWIDGTSSLLLAIENYFPVTTRFRAVPTFGSSTIRRFATNASEMKKLAARDFEDLLQVSLA
jgi:hypothetical protein